MIPIESNLTGREKPFEQMRHYLHSFDFTLGGNWEYDHGYFDRFLDEGHKVWLRLPFGVTHGMLDGDTDSTDAIVQLGTPFVLKHVYNEGLDKEAQVRAVGALVDQFQEPVNQDAPVGDKWLERATMIIREVEAGFPG